MGHWPKVSSWNAFYEEPDPAAATEQIARSIQALRPQLEGTLMLYRAAKPMITPEVSVLLTSLQTAIFACDAFLKEHPPRQ